MAQTITLIVKSTLFLCLCTLSIACGEGGGLSIPFGDNLPGGIGNDLPTEDEEPPIIQVLSDRWTREDGKYELKLEVFDNDRVASVRVLIKSTCTNERCSKTNQQIFRKVYKQPSRFLKIPLEFTESPNIVYIRAVDRLDNKKNESFTIEIKGFSDRLKIPEDDPRAKLGCAASYSDVRISSMEELNELSQINCVWISGDLYLQEIPGLKNLAQLQKIQRIQGKLAIIGNPDLENLVGLGKLNFVQDVQIQNNPKLRTLSGLNQLKTIRNALIIRDNAKLDDVTALQLVEEAKNITIVQKNIKSLLLPKVRTASYLSIKNSSELKTLDVSSLQEVGRLKFQNNPKLTSISSLSNLRTANTLELYYNNLESLDGLRNLRTVNKLAIYENVITSLAPLNSLQTVVNLDLRDIRIKDFSELPESFEGLNNLQLNRMPELISVRGLSQQKDLTNISIFDTPKLSSLEHLPDNAELFEVTLRSATALTHLRGLENNFHINARILLLNLTSLSSLDALANHSQLYSLNIDSCRALNTLKGLDGMRSVQHIDINNNENLNDISALSDLQLVRQNFSFINNPSLSKCDVQDVLYALDKSPVQFANRENKEDVCD